MWIGLRSWFSWRFNLSRLLIAVVILGSMVGLNVREIGPLTHSALPPVSYWGWPLPFNGELDRRIYELRGRRRQCYSDLQLGGTGSWGAFWERQARLEADLDAFQNAARSYRIPWTHQTYRLLNWSAPPLRRTSEYHTFHNKPFFTMCALLNVVFALSVLFLILFLQIPRRRTTVKAE